MAKKNESGRATGAAAAAPPVRHRIEATTICFNEEAAPAGEYTVRVACTAEESLEFRRGGGQTPYVLETKRDATMDDATKTFDLAEIRTAGACRVALRGMLEELPQLRLLQLAHDEWDAVVPEDVVPEIVRAACRGGEGGGFTFGIWMYVRRRVIHDERAFMMARKERAPPVQRRIEANTICFNEEAAPPGEFTVRVACNAKGSLEFRRPGGQRPYVLWNKEMDVATKTFDLAEIRTADACRDALRGMMEKFPQLRLLHLTPDEWDVVVPEDVVPEIVRAACRGDGYGFTFCISMCVRRRVIHDERALLMACKERPRSEQNECAICFDGIEGGEPAVELPVCVHAFHRRCITQWFARAPTCPMCRADVRLSDLSEFVELCSSKGGVAAQQGRAIAPDLG